MVPYSPPLADMRFALDELAGLSEIAQLPGCEQASADLVDAVLEEAAKSVAADIGKATREFEEAAGRVQGRFGAAVAARWTNGGLHEAVVLISLPTDSTSSG